MKSTQTLVKLTKNIFKPHLINISSTWSIVARGVWNAEVGDTSAFHYAPFNIQDKGYYCPECRHIEAFNDSNHTYEHLYCSDDGDYVRCYHCGAVIITETPTKRRTNEDRDDLSVIIDSMCAFISSKFESDHWLIGVNMNDELMLVNRDDPSEDITIHNYTDNKPRLYLDLSILLQSIHTAQWLCENGC